MLDIGQVVLVGFVGFVVIQITRMKIRLELSQSIHGIRDPLFLSEYMLFLGYCTTIVLVLELVGIKN